MAVISLNRCLEENFGERGLFSTGKARVAVIEFFAHIFRKKGLSFNDFSAK